MRMKIRLAALALLCAALAAPAAAQDRPQPPVPFAGGQLTVTEVDDGEKALAFDGRELARNYYVSYDRTVEVGGVEVALVEVGDGGNACGAITNIVWKPEGGEVEAVPAAEDCGSPPAAVTSDAIYFVPFPMPGETLPVKMWSPQAGMRVAGEMAFAPQPDTGWRDVDGCGMANILDVFSNAAVYEAAQRLLGADLTEVASGLIVGSEPQVLPSGAFYGSGCVPHACGVSDAFMAVDPAKRKLYFAQQQDNGGPRMWPEAAKWPRELRTAMNEAIGR
ncbi:MAG: hypothetical protein BGN94_23825 [Rhizobiales bacterium 68-8]|nr:MAG: hypothetical protein BGN94_23825 [Rhizobiales bacterium 68-8]